MDTASQIERWFSQARFSSYLKSCAGDPDRAVQLYLWNSSISAALWQTLGHVEILLRNTMHNALSTLSQDSFGHYRWYTALDALFNERTRRDIQDARKRATRAGRTETVGHVVAELNFGFWRYLLSSHYERTLWLPALRFGFPHLRAIRKKAEGSISELHRLRNRIGHHEPIHHQPIAQLRDHALAVAAWVDPKARAWIRANDTTSMILEQRP